MKKLLQYVFLSLFTLLLAALIGGSTLFYQIKKGWLNNDFTIQNGCWRVNPKMDLENNHFQRAIIAVGGLFALRESEVLYFVANKDDQGRPLHSDYQYELIGAAPNARYWSFTMYASDHYLVPNKAKQFGYNLETVNYDFAPLDKSSHQIKIKNSHFRIVIDKKEQVENWLPVPQDDNFVINLRLYNPAPEIYENLGTCTLPIIRRVE